PQVRDRPDRGRHRRPRRRVPLPALGARLRRDRGRRPRGVPGRHLHQLRQPHGDGHRIPEREGTAHRGPVPQRAGHHPHARPHPRRSVRGGLHRCAGINLQAWILEFTRGREDLYPRMREVMAAKHQRGRGAADLAGDDGDHSEVADGANVYEGGNEQVRTSIMNAFGYFQTESSHHASEYLPYFRKNPQLVEEFIPERWDYYEICVGHDDQGDIDAQLEKLKTELAPSVEYGAQ